MFNDFVRQIDKFFIILVSKLYLLIKIMQRQNKTLTKAQNSELTEKKSLPCIEYQKLTIKLDEQPKPSLIRKISISPKYQEISQINLQSIFSIPKDTIFINRRVIIPTKTITHSKNQQQPQSSLIKKKIQELSHLQNECFYNDNEIFNKVLQQFGLIKHESPMLDQLKMKQFLPNRKLSQQKQKWKLKPIISEVRFKNNKQMDFFNIEKVQLLTGKEKKIKNFNIKQIEQSGSEPDLGFANSTKITEVTKRSNQKQQINNTIIHDQVEHFEKKSKSLNKKVIDLSGNNMDALIIKNIESKTFINRQLFRQKISKSLYFKEFDLQNNYQSIPLPQLKEDGTKVQQNQLKAKSLKRFRKKFQPPFETYHYRNLIWKVNYTNDIFVETPQQYQRKVKAFIGRGNNSCMIVGLISRRSWFSITEKVEEANFVWTQLKQLTYFKKQEPSNREKNKALVPGHYILNSIMTTTDQTNYKNYFKVHFSSQQHADQRMVPRSKFFKYRTFVKSQQLNDKKMQNHLPNNYILGNKKALFNTMSNYYQQINEDVFNYLPLTFHIKDGLQDPLYFDFLKYYHKKAKQANKFNEEKKGKKIYNAWIVKPGQNSNRGNGIKMCLTLEQIKSILKKRQRYSDGSYRTFIVQSYIERPLLYFKRKFDLRHYIMMTCINGIVKGYWYKDGYVRTTSNQYSLKCNSGSIHLTNDAVQKNLPDYGKYQKGNKISYDELNTYIEKNAKIPGKGFYQTIYPKMKKIATDSMRASSGGIDPARLCNNFQIFGMDFMIDSNLQVWLIQINTNPCLELSCPLLGCIIPKMVENALELTMDAMYPPAAHFAPKGVHYYKQLEKQNKFELVYDERVQKVYEGSLTVLDKKLMEEQDDTFQDCGEDWQDS